MKPLQDYRNTGPGSGCVRFVIKSVRRSLVSSETLVGDLRWHTVLENSMFSIEAVRNVCCYFCSIPPPLRRGTDHS